MVTNLTKRYRCAANAAKTSMYDFTEFPENCGPTVVNTDFWPHIFETDDENEMQTWVAENEIIINPEMI